MVVEAMGFTVAAMRLPKVELRKTKDRVLRILFKGGVGRRIRKNDQNGKK